MVLNGADAVNPERKDVLDLERDLKADDLALVPWLALSCVGYGSQNGLLSRLGPGKIRRHHLGAIALSQNLDSTIPPSLLAAFWLCQLLTLPAAKPVFRDRLLRSHLILQMASGNVARVSRRCHRKPIQPER